MAKRSSTWKVWLPTLTIAVIAIAISGGVLAAATQTEFGATMMQKLPMGLFRTHWCGNGKLESRETCDDSNRKNGDGCSRTCQKETAAATCAARKPGESFIGPDGCNTCVCNAGGMACTKMYCPPKSSSSTRTSSTRSSSSSVVSQRQKCLSSEQCARGEYCTTEDGACESACEPGAMVCIQACAGICRTTQCKPYVCPDGYSAASCTDDGHVINYFADPCLTHQSSPAR